MRPAFLATQCSGLLPSQEMKLTAESVSVSIMFNTQRPMGRDIVMKAVSQYYFIRINETTDPAIIN